MKTLFEYKSKISDVIKPQEPMPEDQDQTFTCTLFENGTMSLKFYDNEDHLRSRISIAMKGSQAVEVFAEGNQDFYMMRVNGSQVPLVLGLEKMNELMSAIDELA